jgi:hypothetical protein
MPQRIAVPYTGLRIRGNPSRGRFRCNGPYGTQTKKNVLKKSIAESTCEAQKIALLPEKPRSNIAAETHLAKNVPLARLHRIIKPRDMDLNKRPTVQNPATK